MQANLATHCVALIVGLLWTTEAIAEEPAEPTSMGESTVDSEDRSPIGHALSTTLRASALGYGAQLGYRVRLRKGLGLGLEVQGLYDPEAVLGGYATRHNGALDLRAPIFIPAHRSSTLSIGFLVAPGFRWIRSGSPGFGPDQSLAVTVSVGARAFLHVNRRLTWMLAVDTPVAVQLSPITDTSELGTLVGTGPVVTVTPRVNLYATVDAGGLFGSDGDAGKFLIRGSAGIRVHWGVHASDWTAY